MESSGSSTISHSNWIPWLSFHSTTLKVKDWCVCRNTVNRGLRLMLLASNAWSPSVRLSASPDTRASRLSKHYQYKLFRPIRNTTKQQNKMAQNRRKRKRYSYALMKRRLNREKEVLSPKTVGFAAWWARSLQPFGSWIGGYTGLEDVEGTAQ